MREVVSFLDRSGLLPIISTSKDICFVLSRDFEIIYFNAFAESFFSSSDSQLSGLCFKNLLSLCAKSSLESFFVKLEAFGEASKVDEKTSMEVDRVCYTIRWLIYPLHLNQEDLSDYVILAKGSLVREYGHKNIKGSAQIFSTELDAIIRYAPDLIYWKDVNSVHLGCNDRFALLAGLPSRESVVGKTDFDLAWKDRAALFQQDDAEVVRSGKPKLHIEDILPTALGNTEVVISNKVPLKNECGEIIGVLGIATEVTHLKETEKKLRNALVKAEDANKAKSEFIANMSHDLRIPMTGVLGMLDGLLFATEDIQAELQANPELSVKKLKQLLQDLSARTQEYAEIAKGSAYEITKLLNEILEVVQIDSGEVDISTECFDLRALITRNMDLLKSVAEHKKLKLIAEVDSRVPLCVKGLRRYLDRTLLNLISNALKFTRAGFVKVVVTVDNSQTSSLQVGENVWVNIQIQDTGIGIPRDKFDKIFEHFSRLVPSYQGTYKGSGLGLYTVKNYVEAMHGTIKLESEEGQGSCFTLALPFIIDDSLPRVDKLEPEEETLIQPVIASLQLSSNESKESKPDAARVLLVEDNPAAATAVCLLLRRLECDVEWAKNGREAIEKASTENFNLIFMDIGLPDIAGGEVTKHIRALSDSSKSQVPIVALTGHVGGKQRERCLAAGMYDVLTKPAQLLALQSALRQWVWGRDSTQKESMPLSVLSQLDNLAVVDWEASLSKLGGDEAATRELLSMLVDDLMNTTKPVLAKAYENRDTKALHNELHRCLGGVVYLKLPQLEFSLREFENAIKTNSEDQDTLELHYKILQEAIASFLQASKKV